MNEQTANSFIEKLIHIEPLLTVLLAYVSFILSGIYKRMKEVEAKGIESARDLHSDIEEMRDHFVDLQAFEA